MYNNTIFGPKREKLKQTTTQTVNPILYREVVVSDLPSQYTEDIETFKKVLNIPDLRDNMPVCSASVMVLVQKQEFGPKLPSTFSAANPSIKEALEKFEQDFQECQPP